MVNDNYSQILIISSCIDKDFETFEVDVLASQSLINSITITINVIDYINRLINNGGNNIQLSLSVSKQSRVAVHFYQVRVQIAV